MPGPPHLLDWDNTLDNVPPDRDTQFCVPAARAGYSDWRRASPPPVRTLGLLGCDVVVDAEEVVGVVLPLDRPQSFQVVAELLLDDALVGGVVG